MGEVEMNTTDYTVEAVYKYFHILRDSKLSPRRKTFIYYVNSERNLENLGTIKWYGPWRQFCFYPTHHTVWSRSCLGDINAFINKLMSERKEKKSPPPSPGLTNIPYP